LWTRGAMRSQPPTCASVTARIRQFQSAGSIPYAMRQALFWHALTASQRGSDRNSVQVYAMRQALFWHAPHVRERHSEDPTVTVFRYTQCVRLYFGMRLLRPNCASVKASIRQFPCAAGTQCVWLKIGMRLLRHSEDPTVLVCRYTQCVRL
jgi:hypothetical protein